MIGSYAGPCDRGTLQGWLQQLLSRLTVSVWVVFGLTFCTSDFLICFHHMLCPPYLTLGLLNTTLNVCKTLGSIDDYPLVP